MKTALLPKLSPVVLMLALVTATGCPVPVPTTVLGPLATNGSLVFVAVDLHFAVALDPADPTGNTVYIGGAQGGVWKSTNAATTIANNVTWSAVTDDQATLSIGSIVIQPGNSNPAPSVILVGTGEWPASARLLLLSIRKMKEHCWNFF